MIRSLPNGDRGFGEVVLGLTRKKRRKGTIIFTKHSLPHAYSRMHRPCLLLRGSAATREPKILQDLSGVPPTRGSFFEGVWDLESRVQDESQEVQYGYRSPTRQIALIPCQSFQTQLSRTELGKGFGDHYSPKIALLCTKPASCRRLEY